MYWCHPKKTANFYEMSSDQHNSLLKNSITNAYKKRNSLAKLELMKKQESYGIL